MLEQIISILENYTESSREKITEKSTLLGDLDLNSLDIINIVMDFEDEFGIEIADEDVKKMVTVGDIAQYLERNAV